MDRVLKAWGIDGHNSHTNICSSSARLGYQLWQGSDRPSPDHANARFILLLSAHLESGHYFNPHAQRIIEGKLKGAKLAVIDQFGPTASMADYWLPAWPIANQLCYWRWQCHFEENLPRDSCRRTNCDQFMARGKIGKEPTFSNSKSS